MAKKAAAVIDYPTTEAGMLRAAIAEAYERGDEGWAKMLEAKLPKFAGGSEIAEQDALPQGNGGDNASKHRPAYSNLASEKQVDFIVKLTEEKHGTDLRAEGNESLLALVKNLTKKAASQAIDRLMALPRFVAPVEVAPVAEVEAAPVQTDVEKFHVLPGRYVVNGVAIKVTQGKTKSQWVGRIFVREIESDRAIRGEERDAILRHLEEHGMECAVEFAQLTGCCSNCGRTLTNAESIEAAMGPICAGKFGRFYSREEFTHAVEAEVLEGEIVEDAPVLVQAEDRFKGYALPAAPAPVAEEPSKPSRSIAKGTGVAKAEKVMAALAAAGAPAKLDTYAGVTRVHATVDGKALLVTWDGASFRYGEESTLDGKRFRNVSELLRLIG